MQAKLLATCLALALTTKSTASFVIPRASQNSTSFAGSSEYVLHALPLADQQRYVETLAGWGAKVLRLWVTDIGGGCVKGSTGAKKIAPLEDTVGTYDKSVLEALDNTLKILHAHGMKAIISPHNANSLTGDPKDAGADAYYRKYKSATNFYSSKEAQAAYDARLKTILQYNSPNFHKPWSELTEAIMAFDIQNEPMIKQKDLLTGNDPDNWLCGRAETLKRLIGKSSIKVATGGIGGSQVCCDQEYNLLKKALSCDAIDIMSVHGYMSKASSWAYFVTGAGSVVNQAKKASKHVMIEEWGVSKGDGDNFDKQVKVFNDAGIPWLYWQIVPGKDQTQSGAPASCGYDGFEIGLNSTKGNVKKAIAAAKSGTSSQDWGGYL